MFPNSNSTLETAIWEDALSPKNENITIVESKNFGNVEQQSAIISTGSNDLKNFCNICHIDCTDRNFLTEHLQSDLHKEKLLKSVEVDNSTIVLFNPQATDMDSILLAEPVSKQKLEPLTLESNKTAISMLIEENDTIMEEDIKQESDATIDPDLQGIINNDNNNDYSCDLCKKYFQNSHLLKQHLKTISHKKNMEQYPNEILKKSYRCSICKEQFQSHYLCIQHFKSDSHKKEVKIRHQFYCNICNQSFRTLNDRQRHLLKSKIHSSRLKRLEDNGTLKKQEKGDDMEQYGTLNKDHSCDVCKEYFQSSYQLQRHCKSITHKKNMEQYRTQNKVYSCDVCKDYFQNSYLLEQHCETISHKEKIEQYGTLNKVYSCGVCKEYFQNSYLLEEHWKTITHKKNMEQYGTLNKDFPCDVCKEYFQNSHLLKQHCKSISHKKNITKYMLENSSYQYHKKNYYSCHICKEEFESYYLRDQHFKSDRHKEEKVKAGHQFYCNICDQYFRTIYNGRNRHFTSKVHSSNLKRLEDNGTLKKQEKGGNEISFDTLYLNDSLLHQHPQTNDQKSRSHKSGEALASKAKKKKLKINSKEENHLHMESKLLTKRNNIYYPKVKLKFMRKENIENTVLSVYS